MSEAVEKKALLPKLRFPEFSDSLNQWNIVRIDDHCTSFSGGTPDTTNPAFYGGGIPFIRSAEIGEERTGLTLTEAGLAQSSARLVSKGDVLIALYGANSGNVARAKLDGAINQAVLCLKCSLNEGFVFSYLERMQSRILASYIQGGQGNLSGEIVRALSLPVSSPAEQRKIAECLESLDELIAAETEKLEALKRHKKGLLQQLFPAEGETTPRLRFPSFTDSSDWDERELGKLVKISSGGTPSKDNPKFWNGDVPWISAEAMHVLRVSDSFVRLTAYALESGVATAPKGSLLILTRGSMLFRRVPICITERAVAFNQDVKCLQPVNVNAEFLLYSLISKGDRIPIDKTGIGAGKIETDELKSLPIQTPSPEEQEDIATLFRNMDQAIDGTDRLITKLRTHKAALMQQLFPSLEELDAPTA